MKIAIYTIAKDELKFCKPFVESCKNADGIYVLDTGSKDGTPEKLKELGCTVKVFPFTSWKTLDEYDKLVAENKDPWRFDVARNLNLEMVPDDVDACLSIDLDETTVSNWRNIIESTWTLKTNHMSYFFAWEMRNGKPFRSFWYNKIHARKGFSWVGACHEAITAHHGVQEQSVSTPQILVEHHQDTSKPRTSYLPLLELTVREDPSDVRLRFYLGREYCYRGMNEQAIATMKHYLEMQGANWPPERSAACMHISDCYGSMKCAAGKDEAAVKSLDEIQRGWLMRAIQEDPSQREPWVKLADYGRMTSDNLLGYWAAKKALAIPIEHCNRSYLYEPDVWSWKPQDIASVTGFYVGEAKCKQESLTLAWEALAQAPHDGRLESNYRIIQGCLAKPAAIFDKAVDIIILSYSKTQREYDMTSQCIQSLRLSSSDVPIRFTVVETNEKLKSEPFVKGEPFGQGVNVVFPGGKFSFNGFLQAGYRSLKEPAPNIMLMNNDVTLFSPGFMSNMLEGLKTVISVSPLGLREAQWGLVDRSKPIDVGYDINRQVNGWCIMFSSKLLKAIPFEKLFPAEFSWYGGDQYYAKLLEEYGYCHGLVNAAQALHLQMSSKHLMGDGLASPANRVAMLKTIGIRGKKCVEVGVDLDVFSKDILDEDPASLALVDPWTHQDEKVYPQDGNNVDNSEFERRFKHVCDLFTSDKRVDIIRGFSVEVSKTYEDASLDFVYIDAIHTYEQVTQDIEAWWSKVKTTGWLCGHDYDNPDIERAVSDFIKKRSLVLAFTTHEPRASSWAIQVPAK